MSEDECMQKVHVFRILKYVVPLGFVLIALIATRVLGFGPETNRIIMGAAFAIGLIDFFVFGWLEARTRGAPR